MLTKVFAQSKILARRLRDVAMIDEHSTPHESLLRVFDVLVELIVERTGLHDNVMVGGISSARLWQRLARYSLVDGIDRDNAPLVLREVLDSLSSWLDESYYYLQIARPKNECKGIIAVSHF